MLGKALSRLGQAAGSDNCKETESVDKTATLSCLLGQTVASPSPGPSPRNSGRGNECQKGRGV